MQANDVRGSGGATPGPGRSYALPPKKWDLALGPACDIVMIMKCKARFQIIYG